jgi:23S rRNA (uracil1939-C5)-methyltransferase
VKSEKTIVHEAMVEGLALNGKAFVLVDERKLYLDGVLPGDKVSFVLNQRGLPMDIELLEPSGNRVKPDCFFHGPCGGCDLLELSEKARKREKQQMVKATLASIEGAEQAKLHPMAYSREIIRYMPRVRLHQSRSYEERSSGFLVGDSYQGPPVPGGVVPVTSCALLTAPLNRRLVAARKVLDQIAICLDSLTLMSSSSPQSDRVVGHAVLMKGKTVRHCQPDMERIMRGANLKGLTVATFDGKVKLVLGEPAVTGLIASEVEGGPYESEAGFFVQGNIYQNPVLVKKVLEFCAVKPGMRVVEGFAGAGNFSIALGKAGATVEAVESHPGAVRAGIRNIGKAGLGEQVRLLQDNAIKVLSELEPNPDVLLLDPPRTGTPSLGKIVERLQPNRVVCVFCDLETARKNSNALFHSGYILKEAAGLDLYPRTHHVELICTFTKNS